MIRSCLALLVLLCSGCTTFEYPLVAEHGPELDAALIGRWSGEKDGARVDLEISQDGAEGRVVATFVEVDQSPKTEEYRLLTARIDRWTFGSLSGGNDLHEYWALFRYELAGTDRLAIYLDNQKFWKAAIANKLVRGRSDTDGILTTEIVTASDQELRAIVQGYGTVIFNDDPLVVLTRTPAEVIPNRP